MRICCGSGYLLPLSSSSPQSTSLCASWPSRVKIRVRFRWSLTHGVDYLLSSFSSRNYLTLLYLPPAPPAQVLFILLAILFYGIYERFHFSARKHIDASTMSVIFRLAPVIAFAGSLALFHESLTWEKLFGTGLILMASFIVIHKNPQLSFSRPFFAALVSATALGLAWMVDKPASFGFPPTFYSFILWTAPLAVIAFPLPTIKQLKKEAVIGGWKVALLGLMNVVGYVAQIKALSLAEASKVIPITSSSGTIIVLAGIFLLHEKTFMTKKILAGILMLIGVLLLR